MFEVLRDCDALDRVIPEVEQLFRMSSTAERTDAGHHTLHVLDYAAAQGHSLEIRYATLFHDTGQAAAGERGAELVRGASERLRAPSDCRDLAVLAVELLPLAHAALASDAESLVDLLQRADAFRRPERFASLLAICEADVRGRPGRHGAAYPQAQRLLAALASARTVDAAGIAARLDSRPIPERIRAARVEAVAAAVNRGQDQTLG
jgi:tRNA nucleotidyltransferase (CCA-adding enzyme)